MKREDYADLLRAHDDPIHWECPPSMDYQREVGRFRQFVSELEQRLNKKLATETESHIQDASFHSQVLIDGGNMRFGNFGNMVAMTDSDSIDPFALETVKELLAAHGYVFVPNDLLDEDYTGDKAGVTGIRDWWTRYFDWL